MHFTLESVAFKHKQEIPIEYTSEGKDLSPPLKWSDPPKGTKSFALILDDPDAPDPRAPKLTWVHWVLYNIPANITELAQGIQILPEGTLEGLNDWTKTGYGGPNPPQGRHRYFHKIYALDIILPDLNTPSKSELEQAMRKHILAKAELVGTYLKRRTTSNKGEPAPRP